tara:strand:+ start:343 stop:1818 length:1476 start_codon:yes stop_codon:yes gene_type:complete
LDKNKVNKNNSFISQLFTLVGGSLGTYLFPIIFSPILTRIYTPEEFSVYTIYMTISQIIAMIAAFKYELGIPLVSSSKERYALLRVSILNTIFVSFFVFLFFYIYNYFLDFNSSSSLEYLNDLTYLVPSAIILMSLFYHILYNWLLYKKRFSYISISKIVFGFLYATLPIFIFKIYGLKDYRYLIYSHQIALIIGLFIMIVLLFKYIKLRNISSLITFKFNDMAFVLKKYRKYPFFSSPSQLINTLGIWLPVIVIWNYFDVKYASLYFLSHRAVNMPVMLLGHSIGKIFYSEAASNLNKGVFANSISRYFNVLFHIAFPFLCICVFLAPDIFNVIFSLDWSQSGNIVQILAPSLFIIFIASPLSTIPTIYYKQEIDFKFNVLMLIGRLLVLMIGVYANDLFLGLLLYSCLSFLSWLFYLMYILKLSNLSMKLLLQQSMNNRYEYLAVLCMTLAIYFFSNTPICTLICTCILLTYLMYSFILVIRFNFYQID